MIAQFDCKKWPVKSYNLTCAPTTFSAGRGVGGFKQIVGSQNHYWRGSFTLNPLRGEDMIDFRGWLSNLEGSTHPFDMCICDPFVLTAAGQNHGEFLESLGYDLSTLCGPDPNGMYGLPFSDGTCFSDGTGFAGLPVQGEVSPAADLVAGATSMTINAGYLKRGHRFSTAQNHMYEVGDVTGSTVTFKPPLRLPIAAGTTIEAQHPKIRVRLADDTSGTPSVSYGRWTNEITLNVEEVLTR